VHGHKGVPAVCPCAPHLHEGDDGLAALDGPRLPRHLPAFDRTRSTVRATWEVQRYKGEEKGVGGGRTASTVLFSTLKGETNASQKRRLESYAEGKWRDAVQEGSEHIL